MATNDVAVIVGAGSGLSASLARLFAREGMKVALAARNVEKLSGLIVETKARAYACDATEAAQVDTLFGNVDRDLGTPTLVVFNAGARYRGAIQSLEPAKLEAAWKSGAFGGFLVAQQAAQRMLAAGKGTIILTGATASVKGLAESTPFAMAKFSLRGLAQCLARELAPQGIHVAHVVIDGGIASSYAKTAEDKTSDRFLNPDAIAETYLQLHRQHRSSWTWEIEVRPFTEKF